MLSHSSVKAEYCGVASVVAETYWLHNLLRVYHCLLLRVACHVRVLHVLSHYQFVDIFTKCHDDRWLMRMTVTMAQWSVANEDEDDGDNGVMVWWSLVVAAENLENKGIAGFVACRRTHCNYTAEDVLEVFSTDDLGLDWISAHNFRYVLKNFLYTLLVILKFLN
ncbi:hypothetical protein Tco_0432508 [Tanacetum coccineum]